MIGAEGVAVDRDDDPGLAHADVVLDLSGDAAGDVELGLYRHAGEADLDVGGKPLEVVGQRAARTDDAAERPGQFPRSSPDRPCRATRGRWPRRLRPCRWRRYSFSSFVRIDDRRAGWWDLDRQWPQLAVAAWIGLRSGETPWLDGGDRGPRLDDLPCDEPAQVRPLDDQLAVLARQREALAGTADFESLGQSRDATSVPSAVAPIRTMRGRCRSRTCCSAARCRSLGCVSSHPSRRNTSSAPRASCSFAAASAIRPGGEGDERIVAGQASPRGQQLARDVTPLGKHAHSAGSCHSTFTRPRSKRICASSIADCSTVSPWIGTFSRSSFGA